MARTRPIDVCSNCDEEKEIHGKGLCMKCYNKLRRKIKKFDWSMSHPHCIICKSTEFKHHGKGLCVKCRPRHDNVYKANQLFQSQNPERMAKKREYRKQPEVLERNRLRIKAYHDKYPHKKLLGNALGGRMCSKEAMKKQIEALEKEIKMEQNKK